MQPLLVLVVAGVAALAEDLPPSCDSRVYCHSELLHHVQMARIFPDSKTFVDRQMRNDEDVTLQAFDALLNETNNNPTVDQIRTFVNEYFDETSELDEWIPSDHSDDPEFLKKIKDDQFRELAKNINGIWPSLARKVKPEVLQNPERYSFVPVTHGFIVPGGRFKEIYYWDAYWIVEGLLISGMQDTAKGMIENLMELLNKYGHIPNGNRCYYQERSQPPLLSAMMNLYYKKTKDVEFLRKYVPYLEREMHYWLDTQIVTFLKDDRVYTLLRYYAPSAGPRPESYYEDYMSAQNSYDTESGREEFYVDIKSAAESGWDFSSRWFISSEGDNSGNLTNIHTRSIIPVDLNAIFANALNNMAKFYITLKNPRKAAQWGFRAEQWRANIEAVFWNEKDGIWYDYDIENGKHRKYFYTSNLAPLWMKAVEEAFVKKHTPRILNYLKQSQGLDFPGGVPTSLVRSGEQWDFPNVWPPEVSIVIKALEHMEDKEGSKLAQHLAQEWVRISLKGYNEYKQMFEKYNAEVPGKYGHGGEYTVQAGFGWSNGVVLECLDTYGEVITANDTYDASASNGVSDKIEANETSNKSDDDVLSKTGAEGAPDNGASVLDSLGVVPLVLGSSYVKNLAMT